MTESVLMALVVWLALQLAAPNKLVLLRMPGVLTHEIAHWLAAHLTRSSPGPVRIPWRKDKAGYLTYATVKFTPGFFTAGVVAMAPLFVAPWVATPLIAAGPITAVIAGAVMAHSWPSGADWRVLLSKPASWPAAAAAVTFSYIEWWTSWIAG